MSTLSKRSIDRRHAKVDDECGDFPLQLQIAFGDNL
jgi:hypothetical protein